MALNNLAHVERLFQQLRQRFDTTNLYLSRAWVEHEFSRELIYQLAAAHRLLQLEEEERVGRAPEHNKRHSTN